MSSRVFRNRAIALMIFAVAAAMPMSAQPDSKGQCPRAATEIYAEISSAVVRIVSFGIDPHRVIGRVRLGQGSGVVLGGGLIVTNYHVVHAGDLILVDDEEWTGEAFLIGADPALDIAILELVDPVVPSEDPQLGSYDDLRVGQTVHTISFPVGAGRTMSTGIISALDRKIPLNTISWTTRFIQTDAAISPGSSGGILVDDCGKAIGMITLKSQAPGAENIGYALPAQTVEWVVMELLEKGYVARPWHGLYGQMMTPVLARIMPPDPPPPQEGFLVETVEPGSAASVAGLRGGYFPVLWGDISFLMGGDIILSVDGNTVTSLDTALTIVEGLEIGANVQVSYWRDGAIHDVNATLTERPEHPADLWHVLP